MSGYSFTVNDLISAFFDIKNLTKAICWFLQAIYKADNKSSVFAPWLMSTPRCERNSTSFSFFNMQPTQSKRSPTGLKQKVENIVKNVEVIFMSVFRKFLQEIPVKQLALFNNVACNFSHNSSCSTFGQSPIPSRTGCSRRCGWPSNSISKVGKFPL